MDKLIVNNEIQWLYSINCEIKRTAGEIIVRNKYHNTTDFNFNVVFSYSSFNNDVCYRISSNIKKPNVALKNYIMENDYDINFLYVPQGKEILSFEVIEVDYPQWMEFGDRLRKIKENTHYYIIFYKNINVGKFSTVEDDDIIGIYDFEITENYRGKGIGSKFLKEFSNNQNKAIFIQTWSDNIKAIKSYKKAGFTPHELLYRYVGKDI